ncbi:MAG: hypothetical protein GYB64_16340 [Chloroflexi bacterium]|nr:hypothetical protein [Chloroflexota bacterium]
MLPLIGGIIGILIIAILFNLIFRRIYRRVPPSMAMVVFGRGRTRFVTGGGSIVAPLFEEADYLDLRVKTVKKEKDEVYTIDGIPILLDWVAQVQIDGNEDSLLTAARAFLGKTQEEILAIITETLSANFRAIVGQLTVEAIHRDRDAFVLRVQELASDDMAAMGVIIISMGIEEITDSQGYFEAMAAPQIAVIKRDARIAEAEADREARIRAAAATREAEQAELQAERDILQQKQDLEIRQVEVDREVGLERARAQREVESERARAVEQQQEADILVPARAKREATEIEADGERRKSVIVAEADAEATRKRAEADADATKQAGFAEADRLRALKEAEAEGTRATLLAEAEGRRELATATAAEGEINLRQFVIETLARADVEKTAYIAEALAGVGENVKIVQFAGGNNGNSPTGATFLDVLLNVPEMATILNAKIEALGGENIEKQLARVISTLRELQAADDIPQLSDGAAQADQTA